MGKLEARMLIILLYSVGTYWWLVGNKEISLFNPHIIEYVIYILLTPSKSFEVFKTSVRLYKRPLHCGHNLRFSAWVRFWVS